MHALRYLVSVNIEHTYLHSVRTILTSRQRTWPWMCTRATICTRNATPVKISVTAHTPNTVCDPRTHARSRLTRRHSANNRTCTSRPNTVRPCVYSMRPHSPTLALCRRLAAASPTMSMAQIRSSARPRPS
eukprot:7094494-Prymnesium_polylepis.1